MITLKKSLIAVFAIALCSCGGGGGGGDDYPIPFAGNWNAKNMVLVKETCSQAFGESPDKTLEDQDYSIKQEGSVILYTDSDGSYAGKADASSFSVSLQETIPVLSNNISCLAEGTVNYMADTETQGVIEFYMDLQCSEVQTGKPVIGCEMTYRGTSTKKVQ